MTNNNKDAAIHAGEWLLTTQVKDKYDANCGRYLYCYNLEDGTLQRSSNWQTAFGLMSILSLHKLTGEQKYLDSAAIAVEWIKCLQILDSRDKTIYGAFREETQLFNWCHPRDALSAAWGLLCYSKYIGDSDCMERAVLYADWMIKYAFNGDWPMSTIKLGIGGLENNEIRGSYQSGGILFFLDMYDATGDESYLDTAQKMSEYYVERFLNEKGELSVLIDVSPEIEAEWPEDWRKMHQVNDDFGGIALVKAFKVFGKQKYRDRIQAYIKWLLSIEKPDGGFLEPEMEVGCATVPIFLKQYLSIAEDHEEETVKNFSSRCLNRLISFQQNSSDPQVKGAFLGMDNLCCVGLGKWVNIRSTSYAILALLHDSGDSIFPICEGK